MTGDASTCSVSIDTEIPGNPESVHSAADWLYDLKDSLFDPDELFNNCKEKARDHLAGETSEAVTDYSIKLRTASFDAFERALKAADVVRAFADQLGWRQDDMSGHRGKAVDGGLEVTDYTIFPPDFVSAPKDLPKNATSAQKKQWQADTDAYEDYLKKQELFEELREDVEHTFDELETWIEENLVSTESDTLVDTSTALVRGMIISIVGEGSSRHIKNTYQSQADELRELARKVAELKAMDKSRNKAVYKGLQPPSQQAIDKAASRSTNVQKWLGEADDLVKAGTKLARVVSTTTTLGGIGVEIALGESASTAIVSAAAGAAAVAGVAVGTPVLVTAAVATGVAVAAGAAYENVIPLHVRERVDETLDDAGGWVADRAGDAKDGIENVVDWTRDRWRSAFG